MNKPIVSVLDGQMKLNQFATKWVNRHGRTSIRGLVRDRYTNAGDAVLVPKRRNVNDCD